MIQSSAARNRMLVPFPAFVSLTSFARAAVSGCLLPLMFCCFLNGVRTCATTKNNWKRSPSTLFVFLSHSRTNFQFAHTGRHQNKLFYCRFNLFCYCLSNAVRTVIGHNATYSCPSFARTINVVFANWSCFCVDYLNKMAELIFVTVFNTRLALACGLRLLQLMFLLLA